MGVAAEVISLGEWLDHNPHPVFSCCGWGFRLCGGAGWTREGRDIMDKEIDGGRYERT